jgi:hypothetical protein
MDEEEYMRELEVDFQNLKDEMADREFRYRRYMWMAAISCGGEIRIPPSVQRDVEDPGDLVVTTDPATGDLILSATIWCPGMRGL